MQSADSGGKERKWRKSELYNKFTFFSADISLWKERMRETEGSNRENLLGEKEKWVALWENGMRNNEVQGKKPW